MLIGLLGLAFAAILLARLTSVGGADGPGGGGLAGAVAPTPTASASSSAVASSAATEAPTATATDAPTRTLVPTEVEPSTSAGTTATSSAEPPGSSRTYTVKRGDTLSGIAARFATTWQILAKLNEIKDPSRLKIGAVLELP